MKIAIISDIHVNPNESKGFEILKQFCSNPIVRQSDIVVFLGDIFDLLVYEYHQYKDIYKTSFLEIDNLCRQVPKVLFIEGNHDFSFHEILQKSVSSKNIFYSKNGCFLNSADKKYFFYHGDTIEIKNFFYRIYRFVFRNRFVELIYKYLIPFENLYQFGNSLLLDSKKRHQRYSDPIVINKIKQKFRLSAEKFYKKNKYDFLVCGHSHVKDSFQIGDGIYLNNGFAQVEESFLYFNNGIAKFIDL